MQHLKQKTKTAKKLASLSPVVLIACNSNSGEKNTHNNSFNTSTEPVVVILDTFQTNTSHGPMVLQNFFGEFGNDYKEVTVIAEDVDLDKEPMPLLRAYEDFLPDVINTSWGLVGNTDYPFIGQYNSFDGKDTVQEYLEAHQTLWENGVTVVASAGNRGYDGSTNQSAALSIFPIIVGAVSQYDNQIYDWSDHGSATVHYYEIGDGWGKEGTSFSAPRVAAHVALIKEFNPNISESSIRTILEKNSVYDFDKGSFVQKIDKVTNFDGAIDTRVIVEAVFEIFEGRNPSENELDYWIRQIDNGVSVFDMAREYAKNGIQTDDVPPIERIQAFYHFWLNRESQDQEVVEMFEDLTTTNNWNKTFDNFIKEEQIDTNYSFVYNNFNDLVSNEYA